MPKLRQTAEILKLMTNKERIRNIGVVAHIDHGKTTLTDSLLIDAGLLPSQIAGTARALDYLKEEQERGITIKTANISLLHEVEGKNYVVNLIDTPGHVDFTGKVTRALRATDGAIVVVDAVEEVRAQTETVLRQALQERVKPVLFINKIDRLIRELRLSTDETQEKLTRIINHFNDLVEVHGEHGFRKKWKVDPARDSVAFGSALHRWGFTLSMIQREGIRFADVVDAYTRDKYQGLSKSLPLHDAILNMIVKNCPTPTEAQKYRVPKIWKGDIDSDIGRGMLACDDNGPTVMCITSTQIDPKSGLVATGRLFSGSVREGDRIYLVGARREYCLQRVSMCMGAFKETADRITAGNIAALSSLDLARCGETLVNVTYKDSMVSFEAMKYISEPVMTVTIEPKNAEDLTRLTEALNRLSIEDPNLAARVDNKTGEYLLGGMGELHLETALRSLKEYSNEMEIMVSNPTPDYREGISKEGLPVMAKSPNKCNRFWLQVVPMNENELDLASKDKAKRVWSSDEHRNMIVDATQSVKSLEEARDAIIAGFHWACRNGPMCEQPLMNVKIKLLKAQIDEDSKMREPLQITRAISRAILGSFLTAEPVLLEPIYKIEVSTPVAWFGPCANIITTRRGKIMVTENKGTLVILTANIPVAETLGLSSEIRSATSGHAFWQSTFDHWGAAPQDVAKEVIRQIRTKRGLTPEIPRPDRFIEEY
ncbi:GTP-binding protein [Candidatus Bathyarchaeota archaeon]|nr:GTP-binding protein [Candidatus Bathyarchaeota archaeon]